MWTHHKPKIIDSLITNSRILRKKGAKGTSQCEKRCSLREQMPFPLPVLLTRLFSLSQDHMSVRSCFPSHWWKTLFFAYYESQCFPFRVIFFSQKTWPFSTWWMLLLEYRIQKPGTVGSIHTVEDGPSYSSEWKTVSVFKTLTVDIWFRPPILNALVRTTYDNILSARKLQQYFQLGIYGRKRCMHNASWPLLWFGYSFIFP